MTRRFGDHSALELYVLILLIQAEGLLNTFFYVTVHSCANVHCIPYILHYKLITKICLCPSAAISRPSFPSLLVVA